MTSLAEKQREIAHYTTLGLAVVGLSWPAARRAATEIVERRRREQEAKEQGDE